MRLSQKAKRTRRLLRAHAKKQRRCWNCGSFGVPSRICPRCKAPPEVSIPWSKSLEVPKPELPDVATMDHARLSMILSMRDIACDVGVPAVVRVEAAKLGLEIQT